jgi:5-methylcytosine-specific restriction endonuclease McrA
MQESTEAADVVDHRWVLVLNKHWSPITVTTVYRAFTLMCRDSALALCPDTFEQFPLDLWTIRSEERAVQLPREKFLATPRSIIEKPEIILLKQYTGIPYVEVTFNRRNMYRRDNYQCQYCGRKYSPDHLSIDHVVPRARGGVTSWTNCVSACKVCNSQKADRPLSQTGLRLLKAPEVPRWNPVIGFMPNRRPPSWDKFIKA